MNTQQESLHAFILDCYGSASLSLVRHLEKECKRVARFRNHRVFNLRCKDAGIIPGDIYRKSPVPTSRGHRLCKRYCESLLRARIGHCTSILQKSEKIISNLKDVLLKYLNFEVYEDVIREITSMAERTFIKFKFRGIRKFNQFYNSRRPQLKTSNYSDHPFVNNLSSCVLTEDELSVLNLGHKFCLAEKALPIIEIITGVESGLAQVSPSKANIIRAKVSNLLMNKREISSNLTKKESQTISLLKKKSAIIFLPADKGGGLVCLDKTDYSRKINETLSNPSVYQKTTKDPSSHIYNKAVDLVKKLKQSDKLSISTCDRLRPRTRLLPRFYGLPKTHKAGVPLRPIVSYSGTTTSELASFLASILGPLVGKSEHHLPDTRTFVDLTKDICLEQDEVLVSFDITALFTSVPVQKAMEIIRMRLETDTSLSERTLLSPAELCRLLSFLLQNTFFTQGGQVYMQIHGVPMGSPVSGIVANLFMEDFETKAIATFDRPIRFWFRYIDDVCAALKYFTVRTFLYHLNSIEPTLQFTHELEQNGSLPFLDLLLTRADDGHITTSVYRKPTCVGQYLHFNSNHPTSVKAGIVRSLFQRAEAFSSSPASLESEKRKIVFDLRRNGYPDGFIRSIERAPRPERKAGPQKWNGHSTIPYVKGISETISRIMREVNVQTSFRPLRTIRNILVKPKDQIPPTQNNNIVYQIPCADCPEVYIGQSKRQLTERIKEHRSALCNLHPSKSAVAEHALNNSHNIDWNNTTIVDRCYSRHGRLLKEAIHAHCKTPIMNKDDLIKIPPAWLPNIEFLR